MNEGLALVAVEASWALSHSALPGAPVVPDERRGRRRSIAARARLARVLYRAAEALERPSLQASTC
ncbi:hypothetical protein [Actinotalea fermentans]|uniref:Uncharacterized protein n=1 Tax=Actinotalea fermentans TaxID=43671 RepID=A0A511YVC1_9CELL|nr:hypothetical protein [Actinotalea fermentans]KGM16574.1 hypothetical protein N867_18605 [Actinotalea fermentans ATCC 43279 = JCM 9966 = DSM 3133]GEN79133.1 hypothetical protein AFE02nite_08670 [Actinotalea fermentans]